VVKISNMQNFYYFSLDVWYALDYHNE